MTFRRAAPCRALVAISCVVAGVAGGASNVPLAPPLPLEGFTRTLSFTAEEGTWLSVDISPDETQIVFDPLGDLYQMPATGGAAVALTRGISYDSQPRISPDGKWIAFVSDRDGDDNLWIMRRADGALRRLSRQS